MQILRPALLSTVAFVSFLPGTFAIADTPSRDKPAVVRGAESFGPFAATAINVDLRNLPPPTQWHPGDPIKVIPKRYRGTPAVDHGPDYKGLGPDALAENQRAFTSQRIPGDTRSLSDPIINEAGPGFNGVFPPDTTGEVGANYYVQMINGSGSTVTILNKSDGTVAATFNLHSLGSGQCADGLGDPIVLYDEQAERWLFSEFSNNGNMLCVYISQTPDPITGGWYAYQIQALQFPDYPKYGVWPDAYYIGTNESTSRVYALDRNAMLSGGPTSFQRFAVTDLPGFGFQVLQPADQDGLAPPPPGTPGYFLRHRDDEWHDGNLIGGGGVDASQDFVEIYEFHVDFATPANSTVTGPITIGGFADFDSELCDATIFACFPQPSGPPLDPLREVIMFRVGYRNFGTHESMVGNFVVDLNGANHGGIRWFELRRPDALTPWSLYQEGTYALPLPDVDNRFMGSIAQDQDGNIALAYSVTSSATFPAMRYTGRLETDTPGVMTEPEREIIAGLGSSLLNRWGDYAAMSVDPVDGCTFWHTNMHGDLESWGTQIASFRFDECDGGLQPDFTLNANNLTQAVCSTGNLEPITVTIGQLSGFSDDVNLSFGAMPGGFSGSYTVNPVTPPGTSEANVSVTGAAAGDYSFDIIGSATGVSDKSRTVDVTVTSTAPGSTMLTAPADGSPSEPAMPILEWTAAPDAVSYLVEIDNNADFSSVTYSATTSATAHQVASALAPDDYYWRVTPKNPCGDGTTSQVSTFTVEASLCRTPGLAIPDGSGSVADTIVVGSPGTITDLNVSLDISHTWIGDLTVTLKHAGTGTQITLIAEPLGGNCQGEDIVVTLDDEATLPITGQCELLFTPSISGDFQPELGNFLSDFDGELIAGAWVLTLSDSVNQDSGTLNEWCLDPVVDLPPPPDTDGDGVIDDEDNCVNVANTGQEDGDGDGVGNVCDNCLLEPNTDQCNTNAHEDNFGNVCDADLDNNGIVNSFDLSIMRANFGASGDNDADITCNGIVNSFDLTEMRNDFGQAPGPTGIE